MVVSERMQILLLQSSLTEECTVARGFISQYPKWSVEQVQSLLVEHAHHLQESQDGHQETVLSSQHRSHPPSRQDNRGGQEIAQAKMIYHFFESLCIIWA